MIVTRQCSCCHLYHKVMDWPLGFHIPQEQTWVGTCHNYKDINEIRILGYEHGKYDLLLKLPANENE